MAARGFLSHLNARSRRGLIFALIAFFALSLLFQATAMYTPARTLAAPTATCGVTPLDVEIIIDRSSSMGEGEPTTRLAWAKSAAIQLVNALDANGGVGTSGLHRVGVTTFQGSAGTGLMTPPDARWSSSAANLNTAISGIPLGSGTPLKAGIVAGAADLTSNARVAPVRHILILMSDGEPHPEETQTPSAGDITTYLASADEAFSIGIGLDTELMASLATNPAHYFPLTTAADLPAAFASIYRSIACPALTLTKTPSPTTYSTVGTSIHYSYVVTNTGNVTLTGPVTVSDNKATVACPAGNLAPAAFITCTATYVITQADLDAGSVTNTAQAHIGQISSPIVSATITAVNGPALSIAKTATESKFSAAGDVIHYSYKVTNTGNVTLTGPVTVSDNKATVTCPAGNLAPAAFITCTATHTVTQADITAGLVTNTAQAHAGETVSPIVTLTVRFQAVEAATSAPRITLPPTDTISSGDQGSSTSGFGLLLTLFGIAGIGLIAGLSALTSSRPRRETTDRR